MKKIPVSEPFIGEEETLLTLNALKEKAISGYFGSFVKKFENDFAAYSDCAYGASTNSGTTALHLATAVIGLKAGDEVLVSTLTNMATFFAVFYQGAKAIPIDIDPETLNMDPTLLEAKLTSKTKAIIVVHLFGHPVDMDPVMEIARKFNLVVIEDCAEAHGSTYKGRKVGSIGQIGCFSFFSNKIITTGEGGMLTTNDPIIAEKAQSLKALAFGDRNKFMHKDIGFNYRMTNVGSAMGCAQLAKVEQIIKEKQRLAAFYHKHLYEIDCLSLPIQKSYARNVYWMYHIVLQGQKSRNRDLILSKLLERGIETRPGFIPYNLQEIFIEKGWTKPDECPKANEVAYTSFYLPSSPSLTEEDLKYVVENLKVVIESIE